MAEIGNKGVVMLRLLLLMLLIPLSFSFVGCAGKQVCRKPDVYKMENQAFRRFIKEPTDLTKRFIAEHCSCTTGGPDNDWVDRNTGDSSSLCKDAAKAVQVLEARAYAHLDMSLHIVGLLDQKPNLQAPIPPDYLLCPNRKAKILYERSSYYALQGVE